jgi:hypothetical protein
MPYSPSVLLCCHGNTSVNIYCRKNKCLLNPCPAKMTSASAVILSFRQCLPSRCLANGHISSHYLWSKSQLKNSCSIYTLTVNEQCFTFLYFFPLFFLSFLIPLSLSFLSFSLLHQSLKYSAHILLKYVAWSTIQNQIKKKVINIQACRITLHVSFSISTKTVSLYISGTREFFQ